MNEREEVLAKWNQTIKELRDDYLKWEKHTLRDYVLKCCEILALQVEYKIISIEKQQISSYLYKELHKEGIEISSGYYSEIIPDEYTRNYSKSSVIENSKEPLWQVISDGEDLIEKNQYDEFRINGKEVTERKFKETKDVEATWDSKDEPERIEDDHSKLLLVYSKCGSTIERIFDALRDRYFSSLEAKKEIQSYYKDHEKLTEENMQLLAKLQNSKSLLDDRNRWGPFEKIFMKFLIDTGETTAHLAKAVGYCSKYGSIGIDRNEDLDYVDNPELRKFLRSCPNCHEDIADKLNQDLQRYHLNKELLIITPKI